MNFFSGFCFREEEELFEAFTCKGGFCLKGFSYGAIKAFENACVTETRLDKLQLFSPAFFQNKDEKFKKLQLLSFRKNQQEYLEKFVQNVLYPSCVDIQKFLYVQTAQELRELLYYVYDEGKLRALKKKGVAIEVYLGAKDKIIDVVAAKEFFQPYATIYLLQNVGHILH